MNIRTIHLYLGCIFAPLVLLFAITGAFQTLRLHETRKDGSYQAPAVLRALSKIHEDQTLPGADRKPSIPFRILVVLMAAGLAFTTMLGIVMAFRTSRNRRIIWLCLLGGSLVPVMLLLI